MRSPSTDGHASETEPVRRGMRVAWALLLFVGLPFALMAALVLLASAGIYVEVLSSLWYPWPSDPMKAFVGIAVLGVTLAHFVYRLRKVSTGKAPGDSDQAEAVAVSRRGALRDGSRILAITRKSLSQLANDRRTVAFVLVVPLMLILIFGYGFGGQPSHVAVAVLNADRGPEGAALLANLPPGILDLTNVSSPQAAEEAVQNATAWAGIVIGPTFSQGLRTANASLVVYVDGSSPTIAAAVLGAIQSALQKTLGGGFARSPVAVVSNYVYGSPDTSFIDTLAPGVMALVAVFATTVLSILVLVREKSQGLLERLFATPLRPRELVLGHSLSLLVVAAG